MDLGSVELVSEPFDGSRLDYTCTRQGKVVVMPMVLSNPYSSMVRAVTFRWA